MNKTIDLTCDLGSNSVEHCLDHVTHLKRNIMLILQPMNTFPFSFCYLKPGTGFELLLLGGSDLGADLYCEALVHYSNFLPFPCSILRHSSRFTQFKLWERKREQAQESKQCVPKVFYLGLMSLKERVAFPSAAWPRPRRWHPLPSVSLSLGAMERAALTQSSQSFASCLSSAYLQNTHMLCYGSEEGWETQKRKSLPSFSAASKPVFSYHSVTSGPSEHRRKWSLNPTIFANI